MATNLSITKNDGITSVVPGTSTTYIIVVSNAGPDAVVDAAVTDLFPAAITNTSWTAAAAPGSSVAQASGAGDIATTVSLPVGGTVTFTAVAQIDPSATGSISNTATVSAPAGVTDTNPADNSSIDTDTLAPQADLSIFKTDGTTTAVRGTVDTYTITVTNNGPSTVSSFTLSDSIPSAFLNPSFGTPSAGSYDPATGVLSGLTFASGDSVSITLSGTVDPSATGSISNTATVSPPSGVTDPNPSNNGGTDTDTLISAVPAIQVVKFVNGQDANLPSGPHVSVGSTVTFAYVVTNTGNVPLSNVILTDDKLGTISSHIGDANGNGLLDLTETWTYTATATALAGQQINIGAVSGQDITSPSTIVADNDPANYFGDAPGINVVKFVNGQDADSPTGPHVPAGTPLVFTYVVTNTGNVPLAGVAVTDDTLGPIVGPSSGDSNANGLLDLTETWTYTTIATAQIGQHTNTATVIAQNANNPPGGIVTDTNPANYFGDSPIHMVKLVNGDNADTPTGPHVAAGSTVTFTYQVTNTGFSPLLNVIVTDDKLGPILGFTGDNGNGQLDPFETWTYTHAATAVAGQQTNTGTVIALQSSSFTIVTDNDQANYFGDAPGIDIVKLVNGQNADSPTGPHLPVGSTVTFTYVVTDTGNVPLSNVAVTDDKLGAITSFTGDANGNGLLDLTETWTYTTIATVLAGQQTNVGTVTAQDTSTFATVTDHDPANYFGQQQTSDFNADGSSDVLLGQQSGHFVAEWLMNNGQIGSNEGVANIDADFGPLSGGPSKWRFQDTGDFNGDGKADVLWRHDNGQAAIWTMNGSQITNNQSPGNITTDWHDEGVGDFNGDKRADVLWHNNNGQVALWTMEGTQITGDELVGTVGSNWHFQGLLDANGDGKSDVLLRDSGGQVVLWTMDGAQITNNQSVGNVGLDWNIQGTGDFDGDGRGDVLLRNDSGQVVIWQMNGAQIVSNTSVATPGNEWHVADVGDYNADGHSDILWRNDGGQVSIWEMNGATITNNHSVGSLTSDWSILNHHYDVL